MTEAPVELKPTEEVSGLPSLADTEGEPETAEEERPPALPSEDELLAGARSLLTELRPSGLGELLVTEVWDVPAAEGETADQEANARQVAWARRHELRQLGLLRERPALSYDARSDDYWFRVASARRRAPQAILDPYTEFVAAFADADLSRLSEYRADLREYGRQADAWIGLGKAYMILGRFKHARAAFAAAAQADEHHPDAWRYLGLSQLLARGDREAAKSLARAVDESPGDLVSELALAVAHYHQRKYQAAEEHLRRVAGGSGLRAAARSLLGCALRLQGNWEEARVELRLLQESGHPHWAAVAQQCLDCVQRGEERRAPTGRQRRIWRALATIAGAAVGGAWIIRSLLADFSKNSELALGLLVALIVLGRAVRALSGQESPEEFGNAGQGLPCWQATTWIRPRRAEL